MTEKPSSYYSVQVDEQVRKLTELVSVIEYGIFDPNEVRQKVIDFYGFDRPFSMIKEDLRGAQKEQEKLRALLEDANSAKGSPVPLPDPEPGIESRLTTVERVVSRNADIINNMQSSIGELKVDVKVEQAVEKRCDYLNKRIDNTRIVDAAQDRTILKLETDVRDLKIKVNNHEADLTYFKKAAEKLEKENFVNSVKLRSNTIRLDNMQADIDYLFRNTKKEQQPDASGGISCSSSSSSPNEPTCQVDSYLNVPSKEFSAATKQKKPRDKDTTAKIVLAYKGNEQQQSDFLSFLKNTPNISITEYRAEE